jgi:hypothetical protein
MTVTEAFGDVADIIARMNPTKIIGLKASKQMSDRVEYLVNRKKTVPSLSKKPLNLNDFYL